MARDVTTTLAARSDGVTTARPLVRLIPTVLLGAASTFAILWAGVHLGVVLVAAGAAFIVLLPRHPRSVAAFAVGVVATLVPLAVVWGSGWGCASEVDGVLVEHGCAEPPIGTSNGSVLLGRGAQ